MISRRRRVEIDGRAPPDWCVVAALSAAAAITVTAMLVMDSL